MKKVLNIISCLILTTFIISCQDHIYENSKGNNTLNIYTRSSSEGEEGPAGGLMADVFLFSDGKLKGTKNDVELLYSGSSTITGLNYSVGDHLYFFSSEMMNIPSADTEEELLNLCGEENTDGNIPMFYTGMVTINGNSEELTMKRGLSRIDIQLQGEGMTVKSVTLSGINTTGYLFEQENGSVPQNANKADITKDLSNVEPALGKFYDNVFSLYEQYKEEGFTVSISLMHYEEEKVVTGKLPSRLSRNKIYTISLSAKSLEIIGVEEKDWELGEDIEMSPNQKDKIAADIENSKLSEGAKFNEDGTVLTLPYYGGKQTVVFNSKSDLEFMLEGEGKEFITVTPVNAGNNGFALNNIFEITSDYRNQDDLTYSIQMKVKQKGTENYTNEIEIILPENANRFYIDEDFTQKMAFTDNSCDFERYIDGTLGYIEVPEQSTISVSEGNWIRLDKIEGKNVYAIEGGYKPNDPDADGRVQNANINIIRTSADGTQVTETFSLQRRNWGLPVVEINGTYWCKYNLRGNSKNFEDQIPYCYEDKKDKSENLADFLMACGKKGTIHYPNFGMDVTAIVPADKEHSDILYTILGNGYQGSNTTGLEYKPSTGTNPVSGLLNSDYSFWGYTDQLWPEEDTNLKEPAYMTPNGYQVPTADDFKKLFNANSFSFGPATASQNFVDLDNPDFFKRINRKEATVNGKTMVYELIVIPAMGFIDIGSAKDAYFCYLISEKGKEDNPLILMGHPSQNKVTMGGSSWYTTDVTAFVTYNKSQSDPIWRLNGNTRANTKIEQVSYGEKQKLVKMLRCIKSPVKYIID